MRGRLLRLIQWGASEADALQAYEGALNDGRSLVYRRCGTRRNGPVWPTPSVPPAAATCCFPIDVKRAQAFGLKVSTELPDEVRQLMGLYPQPRNRRPSVEYIPVPYESPRSPDRPRRGPQRS